MKTVFNISATNGTIYKSSPPKIIHHQTIPPHRHPQIVSTVAELGAASGYIYPPAPWGHQAEKRIVMPYSLTVPVYALQPYSSCSLTVLQLHCTMLYSFRKRCLKATGTPTDRLFTLNLEGSQDLGAPRVARSRSRPQSRFHARSRYPQKSEKVSQRSPKVTKMTPKTTPGTPIY